MVVRRDVVRAGDPGRDVVGGFGQVGQDGAGQGFDLLAQGLAQGGGVGFVGAVVAGAPGFAQQAACCAVAKVLGGEGLAGHPQ